MCGDCIKTIRVEMDVQENGLIRLPKSGYLVAKLVDMDFSEFEKRVLAQEKVDNK